VSRVPAGDLSRTKLHVPVPRADVIARPRLMLHLREGLTRPLTLICASAGYGKTTLLSQWLSELQLPRAWLSLDR
jgi:LuxR family transcriptional regulator, maltose regulon positive regulatory protein